MEMPRLLEFNDEWASLPGAYFANVPRVPIEHPLGDSHSFRDM